MIHFEVDTFEVEHLELFIEVLKWCSLVLIYWIMSYSEGSCWMSVVSGCSVESGVVEFAKGI